MIRQYMGDDDVAEHWDKWKFQENPVHGIQIDYQKLIDAAPAGQRETLTAMWSERKQQRDELTTWLQEEVPFFSQPSQ